MCAHLATPGLGVEGTNYLPAGHWWLTSSFRYYNSRQDVLGDQPLDHPLVYANTHVYEFDFSATYALTDRFDLTVEGPLTYGSRETSVEHDFNSSTLHTMHAFGPGNIRLSAECYVFEPRKTPDRNIAFGLGVEFPTGIDDAEDYSFRATGKVLRPVDPAIQPAQGGWGILAEVHAYSSLYFPELPDTKWLQNTFLFADGLYVATPQQYSHTQSVIGDEPELTEGLYGLIHDSIVDEYLARVGVSQVLWPSAGLSGGVGLRFEGVPKYDIIGKSDGFRLPGNSLSFEPSLTLTRSNQSFTVSVPIAVHRYGGNAVAFEKAGSTGPGFDTIADWQLILSYTRQF